MFSEAGRVVAVEPDSLWVEVIQTTACEACSARKGCGQSALAKAFSGKRRHVRALLQPHDDTEYRVDDWVEMTISDSTILQGVLWVYLVPLAGMIGAGLWGQALFPASEGRIILSALAGLAASVLVLRLGNGFLAARTTLYPRVAGRLSRPAAVVPVVSLE